MDGRDESVAPMGAALSLLGVADAPNQYASRALLADVGSASCDMPPSSRCWRLPRRTSHYEARMAARRRPELKFRAPMANACFFINTIVERETHHQQPEWAGGGPRMSARHLDTSAQLGRCPTRHFFSGRRADGYATAADPRRCLSNNEILAVVGWI